MKLFVTTLAALTLFSSVASANVAAKITQWQTDIAAAYNAAYVQTLVAQASSAYSSAWTASEAAYFNQTTWVINGTTYTNTSFDQAVAVLGDDVTQYLSNNAAIYQYQYSASLNIYRFRLVKADGSNITSLYGKNVSEWIYAGGAGEAVIEWTEHAYEVGFYDGFKNGYQQGYAAGYNDGYADGFADGYHEGYDDAELGLTRIY